MQPHSGDLVSLHSSSYEEKMIDFGVLISSERILFTAMGEFDHYESYKVLTTCGLKEGSWYLKVLRARCGDR